MLVRVVLTVLLIWTICAKSKIIFNANEFLMEVSFGNIQHAVNSGYMKCNIHNEHFKVDENIYNGSHIIFSYERVCYKKNGIDHTNKDNVYNQKFACSYKFVDPVLAALRCNAPVKAFVFEDTCAIAYDKACQQEFLGPCIGQFAGNPQGENSPTALLQFDTDTIVMVNSKDLQGVIGKLMTCDNVHHIWKGDETQYDNGEQVIFRYGNVTCAIEKSFFLFRVLAVGLEYLLYKKSLDKNLISSQLKKMDSFLNKYSSYK